MAANCYLYVLGRMLTSLHGLMIDLIPSITHLGSYTPVAVTSLMLIED